MRRSKARTVSRHGFHFQHLVSPAKAADSQAETPQTDVAASAEPTS